METITGTVRTIRFKSTENGWCAFTVELTDGTVVPVTGTMPGLNVGMSVQADGDYETNKFGKQFKATSLIEKLPSDKEGIYKYLSSGLIKHIGPVMARKIVETFGDDTLEVLDNDPERLNEISGVGKKRIGSIIEALRSQKSIRTIMIWLKRHDLPNGLSAKIYKTYGDDAISTLQENPYRLASDIKGVGFKKADDVAKKLSLPADSPFRIESGILACLEDAATRGNTFLFREDLLEQVSSENYLDLPEETVRTSLDSGFFSIEEDEQGRVFLPLYGNAEDRIAERLTAIANHNAGTRTYTVDFEAISAQTGIRYSDEQQAAIAGALRSRVFVLTGGPGTGKTATTNAIIRVLENNKEKVVLTAPTGRAAKRMSEVSGRPSKTIHRLLEFKEGSFTRNRENPIEGDTIIVDEASMIDTILMKHLTAAVSNHTRLIIVGDTDQLPSVGAGSVLRDIIASGRIPCKRLSKVFRQAQGSDIIMNAHAINRGQVPALQYRKGSDFAFAEIEDREDIQKRIVSAVHNIIDSGKAGLDDIQVLTPMRRDWDPIAAVQLNETLQRELNPGKPVIARRGTTAFTVGDRIMVTKNNYEKEVFNGDIGYVFAKPSAANDDQDDEDRTVMLARFDDRTVEFSQEDLHEIELAYACTIHKSQGSEYPYVIIPIHTSHFIMLKRNLIYTGLTRAKKFCMFIGTKKAFAMAVRNEDTEKRNTLLGEKIQNEFRKADILHTDTRSVVDGWDRKRKPAMQRYELFCETENDGKGFSRKW